MTAILSLESVVRRFRARGGWLRALGGGRADEVVAVDDVSLEIRAGDRLGIVGESGGGKSTLARLLAGLVRPDAGVVRWHGVDVATLSSRARDRQRKRVVQLLFQNAYSSLNPRLTAALAVRESVRCHLGLRGRAALDQARVLLERAGAAHCADRPVRVLSGGERRRVTLACLLAASPEVILCDEPVAGLDPILRNEAVAILRELLEVRPETALVVISHELEVVRHLCQHVVVMQNGRLVEHLPSATVEPSHPHAQALYEAQRAGALPEALLRRLATQRGVAFLEYLTVLSGVTIFLGALFALLGPQYRQYLDFATWWLSIPRF